MAPPRLQINSVELPFVVDPSLQISLVSSLYVRANPHRIASSHNLYNVGFQLGSVSYSTQRCLVPGQITSTSSPLFRPIVALGRDWIQGYGEYIGVTDVSLVLARLSEAGVTTVSFDHRDQPTPRRVQTVVPEIHSSTQPRTAHPEFPSSRLSVNSLECSFIFDHHSEESFISPSFVWGNRTIFPDPSPHKAYKVELCLPSHSLISVFLPLRWGQVPQSTHSDRPTAVKLGVDFLTEVGRALKLDDVLTTTQMLSQIRGCHFRSSPEVHPPLMNPPMVPRVSTGPPSQSIPPSFHNYTASGDEGLPRLTQYFSHARMSRYSLQYMDGVTLMFALNCHSLPVSSSYEENRRVLISHLISGHCSSNEKSGVDCPSGCFGVGREYDSATSQAFHAFSLIRSYPSPLEAQFERALRLALLIPFDSDFAPAVLSKQNEVLLEFNPDTDVAKMIAHLNALDKASLVSLAIAHSLPVARATKEVLMNRVLVHFAQGACSERTVSHIPVGCAHLRRSLHGPQSDDPTVDTPDNASVALLLLMSKTLRTKKQLQQLCEHLDIVFTRDTTHRHLRRSIRQYAITLRKSKGLAPSSLTSDAHERLALTASRWPEAISSEKKLRLMDRFDEELKALTVNRFVCACCASVRPRREFESVNFHDLDFSCLRRPDKQGSPLDQAHRMLDNQVDLEYLQTCCFPDRCSSEAIFDHFSHYENHLGVSGFSTDGGFEIDAEDALPVFEPSPRSPIGPKRIHRKPWLAEGYTIPSSPFQGYSELQDLLLDPEGVVVDDTSGEGDHEINLCTTCHRSLSKGKLPKLATANRLYLGEVPKELRDLTSVEENMISRVQNVACVYKFSYGDKQQRKMNGHAILYPQNPTAVVNVLPPSLDDLQKHVCVVVAGSEKPTEDWLAKNAKPLLIRPQKIRSALLWLIEHNPCYRDVRVNHAVLDSLPEESVLPVHIEHVVSGRHADPLTSGYDPLLDSSEVPDQSFDFEKVMVGDVDQNAIGDLLAAAALRHVVNQKRAFVQVHRSKTPAVEFGNPELLPSAFPTLFPYGMGGFSDTDRPVRLGFEKQLKHYMELSDTRFQEHYSFMFVAFNMLQRHSMLSRTSLLMKRSSFRRHASGLVDVNPLVVHNVAIRVAKGDSVTADNDEERKVLNLLKDARVVTSRVPGSAASRRAMRNEIRGLITEKGAPSFFITINPADIFHPIVSVLDGRDVDFDLFSYRDLHTPLRLEAPDEYQGIRIAKNPFLGARFFDSMIQSFIKGLLGYDPDSADGDGGLFGAVNAYYGCVEAQGRGTLHCHMLVWIDGALNPNTLRDRLKTDVDFRDSLMAYLHDNISSCIPPFPAVPYSESPNPARITRVLRKPNETPGEFFTRRMKDLRDIAKRAQTHEHTHTCFKYCSPEGPFVCRFDLDPSIYRPDSAVDLETGELTLRCLDGMVNWFNPTVLEAMRCNMDIKFIGSGASAKAILYYITDYITKTQLKAHVAFSAIDWAVSRFSTLKNPTLTREQHAKSLLNRCAYALLSKQELSGPQVASYILGFGDKYTSHKFRTFIWSQYESHLDAEIPSPECYPSSVAPPIDTLIPSDAPIPLDTPPMTIQASDPDVNEDSSQDEAPAPHLLSSPEIACPPNSDPSPLGAHEVPSTDDPRDDDLSEAVLHSAEASPGEDADVLSDDDFEDSDCEDVDDGFDCDEDEDEDAILREHVGNLGDTANVNDDVLVGLGGLGLSQEGASPVMDYALRGNFVSDVCLWDFVAQVNKVRMPKRRKTSEDVAESESEFEDDSEESDLPLDDALGVDVLDDIERTRPSGEFLPAHLQCDSHKLVVAKPVDRYVPVPLGPSIPRRDQDHVRERYCRTMLLLFKPWRTAHDLRGGHQTWSESFEEWLTSCSERIKVLMDNMQLLHECRDSRDDHYEKRRAQWARNRKTLASRSNRPASSSANVSDEDLLAHLEKIDTIRTRAQVILDEEIQRCRYYSQVGNLFSFSHRSRLDGPMQDSRRGCLTDVSNESGFLLEDSWRDNYHMRKAMSRAIRETSASVVHESPSDDIAPGAVINSALVLERSGPSTDPDVNIHVPETPERGSADELINDIIVSFKLNSEQKRAFRILALHSLDPSSNPLRMFMGGPGGTGKSTVIKAFTEFLSRRGELHRVRLSSYTGIAARNVGGHTLHSILPVGAFHKGQPSPHVRDMMTKMWRDVDYLIVDEVSMIGCKFMFEISEALRIARQDDRPFGGINILFAGDFAQLPPVGDSKLFKKLSAKKGAVSNRLQKEALGKLLWYSVDTVVMLTEVVRSRDPRLTALLGRLRNGRCTEEDFFTLNQRLVHKVKPTWNAEWEDSKVIVFDNHLKNAINEQAVQAFAEATGRQVHWYYSVDSVNDRCIDDERILSLLENRNGADAGYLLGKIPLVLGMPVMITHNFDVNGGVVNGCIGELTRIRYKVGDNGRRHATSCVVKIEGIETTLPMTSLLPDEAAALAHTARFNVTDPFTHLSYAIQRSQLPIQPAFAITSHKSQGRTLERVVVDLASCRGIESAYVMVSRATTLDGLLVLRPFDFKQITCRPSEDRRAEESRLEFLRLQTTIEHPHNEEESEAAKLALKALIGKSVPSQTQFDYSIPAASIPGNDAESLRSTLELLSSLEGRVDQMDRKLLSVNRNELVAQRTSRAAPSSGSVRGGNSSVSSSKKRHMKKRRTC